MPKHFPILFILLAMILAGCQGYTPTPTQAISGESAVDTPGANQPPTAAPATPTKSLAGIATADTSASSSTTTMGCTVQSPFPTPGPTEQSLFPPAGETDWVSGPNSAAITFIEYGDFQ